IDQNDDPLFLPMKPAFTVLLPMHSGYVGGDTYFGLRSPGSVEDYLFVEVTANEHNALRSEDKRKIKPENVLSSPNCAGLARAIVAFVLSACIRQWQQREAGEKRSKYAMVIHNDTQKAAHAWQEQVIQWIFEAIVAHGAESSQLTEIFTKVYEDLRNSVLANGGALPDFDSAYEMFMEAFEGDEVARECVNSDKDVLALLDDNAELRLRTSFNIFIGGSILDRGITIPNLISFYYGRNPQTTQADTVLQHSRMYGNRSRADIAVTRLYTSTAVYDRMYTINSFETALREAFENKASQDQGVVFIQTDPTGRVRPCAPNKLSLSDIVTMRSGGYYLPTRIETTTAKAVRSADKDIIKLIDKEPQKGTAQEIDLETAEKIISILEPTLAVADTSFDWNAMKALLRFYANKYHCKIDLYVERNRALDAKASGDKTGESIVGVRMRDILRNPARRKPALILLEQEGSKDLNWSGYKFWWPVLVAPEGIRPCIFASKVQA
ncbi:MAG: Z1 domain-containing protein, partial [Micavibrio sp.]